MSACNYLNEQYFDTNTIFNKLEDINTKLLSYFIIEDKKQIIKGLFKQTYNNVFWDLYNNAISKQGIYAFAEITNNEVKILYIGISKDIRKRFIQHTKRKDKKYASWAHIVQRELSTHNDLSNYYDKIKAYQNEVMPSLYFGYVPIEDNMILHIAEVYCANKLKSHYNTFKTH